MAETITVNAAGEHAVCSGWPLPAELRRSDATASNATFEKFRDLVLAQSRNTREVGFVSCVMIAKPEEWLERAASYDDSDDLWPGPPN